MNKQFLLFLFAVVVALCLIQCKRECNDNTNPDCPNYCPPSVDLCAGKSEVSARFTICQHAGSSAVAPLIEVSRVVAGGLVVLKAERENATYKWVLGADTLHTQTYSFVFSDNFIGQTIPIKLIIQDDPDLVCFPQDDGLDTITKFVYVLGSSCELAIFDNYWGAWEEAPNDSFEIALMRIYHPAFPGDCGRRLVAGMDGNIADTCDAYYNGATDRYLDINDCEYQCRNVKGIARLDESLQNVQIIYSIFINEDFGDPDRPRENHIFNGHKIN